VRVLVTTFPGKGHFHPVAPLALALQRAGHAVRVATAPEFGRWVEQCGLAAVSAGRPEAEMAAEAAVLDPEERQVQLFTSISVPAFAADVLASTQRWSPDLVISEEGELAGPLIASLLGVPSATHSWPAPARPAEVRAAQRHALDDTWQRFGASGPARVYGDRYVDCCPPPLQTADIESITGVMAVRPDLFDGPLTPSPPWLQDLAPPVVFVTLGTVALYARPPVLRLIAESVAPMFGTVIVSTGPHPETVIPVHARIRAIPYLPLSTILPMADLVVSHGGASTTAGCLLTGTPQLVVPQGAASQQRVATRLASAGLGRMLDNEPLHGVAIAFAAAALLEDGGVRERIDVARRTLQNLPGPDSTASALTELW